MAKTSCTVPISQIILDEEIYPRSDVYPKRVSMFAENMRDGFKIDPIEVQIHPEYDDKYRILDGAHRWQAYKEIGATEIPVHIITLDGLDPLLYAAKKAIGPLQLTEDEARTTARRAYENNPRLTSFEIGQAIGRSRQTVDAYIADLRASTELEMDLKTFRMHRLGLPQERIAKRLCVPQRTLSDHLAKMPSLAIPLNADLSKGFIVPQVAEKHGWAEPLVWSIALKGKSDLDRFKAVKWGLRTWDLWNWNDCDKRFGDDWPGRIPALGNLDILHHNSTGFFCSSKCPGDLIVKTYDIAQILRNAGMTVISGFHSPMERECLTILLRGAQPVIICPARSINNMRINREYKKTLKGGQLLFLSPFDENQRRISAKRSHYRNLFVAAMSFVIFVAHAGPASKTESFCKEILSWQKPIYTFESDYNKNLIKMGALPVNTDNVSEWGMILG